MLEYLIKGGFLMVPLFAASVVSLAVIIDRLRAFRLAEQTDPDALFGRVTHALGQRDLEGAIQTCQEAKGPIAAVLYVGLHKYRELLKLGRSNAEIEESLNTTIGEYAPHVLDMLEKRLNLLLMIGSISPLLGMTGTVTGMIKSFNALAAAGGLEGGVVAAGIAEALITTAAGLLIAIPAVVFYNIFTRKVDSYTLRIQEVASDTIEYIHMHSKDSGRE